MNAPCLRRNRVWFNYSKAVFRSLTSTKAFLAFSLAILLLCVSSTVESATLSVQSGWNLLSSRVSISASVLSNWPVESVWKWSGGWEVYLPQQGDKGFSYADSKNFKLITQIQPGEGFWVRSNSNMYLNIPGTEVEEANLSFAADWNLKGLKTTNKVYAPEMFSDVNKVKSVWKWYNGNWAVYLPGADTEAYAKSKGFSQLSHIMPNEGFWVHANTSFQVDTSVSSLSDEEIEKALATTQYGTDLASNLGNMGIGLPNDIASGLMNIQLFKAGPFKVGFPQAFLKGGLYGSYSGSSWCTYGGSISFSASWTGPNEPSSTNDILNPKLTITASNCKEQEGTFSGSMTIELYGYLSNPTGGKITFSNFSGTVSTPEFGSVKFSFPNLVMAFTQISSNEVELTINGSGNATLNKETLSVRYFNYKIKEKQLYSGYQQTISGQYANNYTNGFLTFQTVTPLQYNSSGTPVSGEVKLMTCGYPISIKINNGSYDIYRYGKHIKTVSSIQLENLFK